MLTVTCREKRQQHQSLSALKVELQAKLLLQQQDYETNTMSLKQALPETASVGARQSNVKVHTLLQAEYSSALTCMLPYAVRKSHGVLSLLEPISLAGGAGLQNEGAGTGKHAAAGAHCQCQQLLAS